MKSIVTGAIAAIVIAVIVGFATSPASQSTSVRYTTENVRL